MLFAGGSYWQIFPLRGLTSDNFDQLSVGGKVVDYFWHITLPVLASTIAAFATLTLLTKNSFLDEIKKHYVMTARAKGLSERRVLYGHVFRNAMLIVIAGFPAVFIGVFFGGSLIIETIFALMVWGVWGSRRLWRATIPSCLARCSSFGLIGLVVGIISDSDVCAGRPAHRFRAEGRLMALSPLNQRRWRNFTRNRRAYWSLWIFACCSAYRCLRNLSPTTNRSS